ARRQRQMCIRDSVWVEVYVNKNWIRIDPTPGSQGVSQREKPLWLTIRLYSDTINYYWNRMVIGYDFERQFKGVMAIQNQLRGFKKFDFKSLKGFLENLIIASVFFLLIFILIYTLKNRKSPEQRLVNTFQEKLKKRGYIRNQNQGLREFVSEIEDSQLRQKAMSFVEHLEGIYYKDKMLTKEDRERLKAILKDI
ncbi:MAG: hypothetical protein N2738_03165, partial [Thermodesulfovibrionales bacterium]|nr:hypothetical protein [Thermodesulfovibrionales bacterium]